MPMNKNNTIFSEADILLPAFSADPDAMKRWAVIACDQFTSQPEYWESCTSVTGSRPSALGFIMPEAWLGTDREKEHADRIRENMAAFNPVEMRPVRGFIRLERTLPDGSVRRGIVGKIDLDAYDYSPGSSSPVRATEKTVLERIPPRMRVRAEAAVELPHILILADDRTGLFDFASALPGSVDYDFELMQGGGSLRGWRIEGHEARRLTEKIAEYESSRPGMVYAMGDGNHSLAAAKAHWENVKRETGDPFHPARYALCEITPLGDASLRFEPIYRLLKNCDPDDFFAALASAAVPADGSGQTFEAVSRERHGTFRFVSPTHALTVGSLQDFLDAYVKATPGVVCDYIHGESTLRRLAEKENTVGFLFPGLDKDELFPYVEKYGTLPRKTFSMGEAESKRYYLECRRITL